MRAYWALWAVVLGGGMLALLHTVRSARSQIWAVLGIGVLAFALRGGLDSTTFYGLEYEDAYVYTVSARAYHSDRPLGVTGGLPACAVGSLADCAEWEVFPGHLLGLPAILAAAQSIFGYAPTLALVVSAALSSCATWFVWWTVWAMHRRSLPAATAALVFATTPAFVLYGGAPISETASAVPLAIALGATAMTLRESQSRWWWAWHSLVLAAVLLAALTRRENLALLSLAPVLLKTLPPGRMGRLQGSLAIVLWCGVGVVALRFVWPSVLSEAGEYGGFSFGLNRLINTGPTVIRALLHPGWFGLLTVGAAVALWQGMRTSPSRLDVATRSMILAIALTVGAMIASYSSHVRSAYQLAGDPVDPFDFLRYLSNLGVLLSVLFACALVGVSTRAFRGSRGVLKSLTLLAVAYFGLTTIASIRLRHVMSEIENEVRLEPARYAIEMATRFGNRHPIVTLEPLVVQLYGSPSTKVISLPFLTPEHTQESGGLVLYLRQDHYGNETDLVRYASGFAALPVDEGTELGRGRGWVLLALAGR